MAASRQVEWRHFVEVNSRNLGGGHVCWGSYDGFEFAGWRGGYGSDTGRTLLFGSGIDCHQWGVCHFTTWCLVLIGCRWTAWLQHSERGALSAAADVAREWVVRGDSSPARRPRTAGADASTALWRLYLHVYQQLARRVPIKVWRLQITTFAPLYFLLWLLLLSPGYDRDQLTLRTLFRACPVISLTICE